MQYGDADERSSSSINDHLSGMRACRRRDDADGCVSVVLRMHVLPYGAETARRGLLRLLFLRHCAVPTDTGRQGLLRIAGVGRAAAFGWHGLKPAVNCMYDEGPLAVSLVLAACLNPTGLVSIRIPMMP